MAGFTGFSIGHVNHKTVFIPIDELISGKYSSGIDANNRNWQRLIASNGQPSFINKEKEFIEQQELPKN